MTVLTKKNIHNFNDTDAKPLIENFYECCLEPASYDMRLGKTYTYRGETKQLDENSQTLKIEPGDFVLLSTLEVLNMPLSLVGHNGIMSPWARRGLVSLFSPQIDPGFEGFLKVPVFNAGDAPISINLGEKIFTVEFLRTDENAESGWSEIHGRQTQMPSPQSPSAFRPNLTDIDVKLETMEKTLISLNKKIEATDKALTKIKDTFEGMERGQQNKWTKHLKAIGIIGLGFSSIIIGIALYNLYISHFVQ